MRGTASMKKITWKKAHLESRFDLDYRVTQILGIPVCGCTHVELREWVKAHAIVETKQANRFNVPRCLRCAHLMIGRDSLGLQINILRDFGDIIED